MDKYDVVLEALEIHKKHLEDNLLIDTISKEALIFSDKNLVCDYYNQLIIDVREKKSEYMELCDEIDRIKLKLGTKRNDK